MPLMHVSKAISFDSEQGPSKLNSSKLEENTKSKTLEINGKEQAELLNTDAEDIGKINPGLLDSSTSGITFYIYLCGEESICICNRYRVHTRT